MTRATLALLAAMAAIAPAAAWAQEDGAGAEDPAREARVRRAMERMEGEPTIIEVHRAALRYFRVHPSAIDRLRHASVARAGAPTLTLSGRYDRVMSARDVVDPIVPIQTDDSFQSDVMGGSVSLRWDFPGTIFHAAQLQTYALVGIQMNLLKEVTRLYYVRRQLMLSLLTEPPADPRARLALELRIEEFTSLIDSFTGGWFSRQIDAES